MNRPQLYSGLLIHLREKLLQKIRKLSNEKNSKEKLEALLDSVFPYIQFDELKVIPIEILKRMAQIPEKFLKQLKANSDAFNVECFLVFFLYLL